MHPRRLLSRTCAPSCFAILALVCLMLLPGQSMAENKPDKAFDDWTTSFPEEGRESVFAMFGIDTKDKTSALYVSKSRLQCDSVLMSISCRLNAKPDKDTERQNISGELRVDQHPIHSTSSRVVQKSGAETGNYYIDTFSNPQTLLGEMNSGQMIRMRFKVGEQEWYYRFSLKGFQPAYERLSQLCASGVSGQGRRPATPQPIGTAKPKGTKSDADFFDTKKPSGSNSSKSDKDFF